MHDLEVFARLQSTKQFIDFYQQNVDEILKEIPVKIQDLLQQPWARDLPPSQHKRVIRELTLPFGRHHEMLQVCRQKLDRLGKGVPKLKAAMRNSMLKDVTEMMHSWETFSMRAPVRIKEAIPTPTALTFLQAMKKITDAKGWTKAFRLHLIWKEKSDESVWVWNSAMHDKYIIGRKHLEEHWDVSNTRPLHEDEIKWEQQIKEDEEPGEWKVSPPKSGDELLEVGFVGADTYFLGPDGHEQRRSCIVLQSDSGDVVQASTEGVVENEELQQVHSAYVLHMLRTTNELCMISREYHAKLKDEYTDMIGDTAINLITTLKMIDDQRSKA